MRIILKKYMRLAGTVAVLPLLYGAWAAWAAGPQKARDPALLVLLPEVEGWVQAEAPRSFFSDTLYEYIDGAAESYILYDFKELVVAQFSRPGADVALTLEIYDMGNGLNAFGIYGAERFPENKTVAVGAHGYVEGEVLNFFVGKDYVKLLCFNGGEGTVGILESFARKVAAKAGNAGGLPAEFALFPKEGLVANSEKYIRRNVWGFEFLSDAYLVSYRIDGVDCEGFVIRPGQGQDPSALAQKLLDFFAKDGQTVASVPLGHHVRNKYAQNMYLGIAAGRLCGVSRVPDGSGKTGEADFERLVEAVKKGA